MFRKTNKSILIQCLIVVSDKDKDLSSAETEWAWKQH